jgi:hypothetical protein
MESERVAWQGIEVATWLLAKLAVNPADTEFDFIYADGSHTLNDPRNKVHLIEEIFQRLVFYTTNFESLS